MSLAEFLARMFFINIIALGNGPTMLALMQAQLVRDRGVLTQDQLLYAFAIARVTPGQANLYIAAVGYFLFGLPGAVLAIVAVVLPGYTMLPLQRGFDRLGTSPLFKRFTRGLTSATVGVIFATAVQISLNTLSSATAWIVFGLTVLLLWRLRLNAIVALVIASIVGLVLVQVLT